MDAFVFLVACAVVATALISSLPDREESPYDVESFLERAHRIILRSSYDLIEGGESGVKPTVQESIQLCFYSMDQEKIDIRGFERHMDEMLERLLPSFLEHHWSARCGSKIISTGQLPSDNQGDRYTSTISFFSPLLQEEVVLRLTAWY